MLAKSSKHNFWEYEFTDYNSVHFPEVLRLFYPKPLKNFKLTPLCHLLQQILMELAAKPQKKKKKKMISEILYLSREVCTPKQMEVKPSGFDTDTLNQGYLKWWPQDLEI